MVRFSAGASRRLGGATFDSETRFGEPLLSLLDEGLQCLVICKRTTHNGLFQTWWDQIHLCDAQTSLPPRPASPLGA